MEEDSTIKFSFLSIDDYERSLSFLLDTSNGIKSVDGSMKLHAASLYSVQIMGEEQFLFLAKLFWNIFQVRAYDGWRMVDLQQKRNPSISSRSEKAVKIPENEATIAPDINDHVGPSYDRKVYIGKVLEILHGRIKTDAFLFFTVLDYFHFF